VAVSHGCVRTTPYLTHGISVGCLWIVPATQHPGQRGFVELCTELAQQTPGKVHPMEVYRAGGAAQWSQRRRQRQGAAKGGSSSGGSSAASPSTRKEKRSSRAQAAAAQIIMAAPAPAPAPAQPLPQQAFAGVPAASTTAHDADGDVRVVKAGQLLMQCGADGWLPYAVELRLTPLPQGQQQPLSTAASDGGATGEASLT
jgi:hypothetical protein